MVDESALYVNEEGSSSSSTDLKKRKHTEFSSASDAVDTDETFHQEFTAANSQIVQEVIVKETTDASVTQLSRQDPGDGVDPLSQPKLERVVSPDAIIDGVDKKSTGENPATKKIKTVPVNQNQPSGDATSESPTASTIQKDTNTSSQSSTVHEAKGSIVNQNKAPAPDQGEQPPSQRGGHSQEKKEEQAAPQPNQAQQAPQPQQIPAIVDQETPPTSSTSTPPSSPGSVVNRTNKSGGLKEAPPYSYKPELTKQLINQPIKPEQAASQTYLESFLRAKQKFKERAEQRRENRKFHLKKRSRLDAALEAPPLLRNDLILNGNNTSSRYFHSMKGNLLGPSGGQYQLYADQSVPASPALTRDWRDSGRSAAGDNLPILLNSGNNNSRPVLTNYGKTSSFIGQENSLNHPYGPLPDTQRQGGPIPDNASPTASLVATEEPSVTLKDLTNDGQGAEWTCVFSGVAQTSSDEFDTASFEEHLQRLLGYRLLFEGGKQGAKSCGDECLMLLPKDERTRMANGIKKMDGTLERQGDTYSTDPSVPLSPVLCFGWRPNKDGRADDYGLDDFWSDPSNKKDVSEGESHSVQVTFEGHTGNGDHPWCEYFPFGSLFGLDMQYNAEVVELQDNYWSHGIVVVFHWMGEEQSSRKTGMVKEFALFVPTSEVRPEDVRIDTAPFTCYYSPEYADI